MSPDRDEYERTLFDKYGPDAALSLKAAGFLVIPIVAGASIGLALSIRAQQSAFLNVFFTILGAFVGGLGYWVFVMGLSRGAGAFVGSAVLPSGNRTPYERQYSREDSLVMRGDVAGALSSYEEIILESPDEAQPRIRAAELCAKSGYRDRAEMLYRSVQRLTNVQPKDDIFASNRLVDLYLAWPGHETKGLRELRRIIDTYPETDVANRARAGLAQLKSQLGLTE